jgi:cell division transport system permease protein
MAKRAKTNRTKKGKANYLYSIVGVALVLFLLGILGSLIIYTTGISDGFKENIEVQVIFNDATKDEKALALKEIIEKQAFTKSVDFINKEDALKEYQQTSDKDVVAITGFNPLFSSLNVHLNAAYVNTDSLVKIKRFLEQSNIVREVAYKQNLVDAMVDNVQKISLILLGIAILLILAVAFLIDNTIRLAMFSNRFLIKTMQMVGATRKFIAKPFTRRGLINGVLSGIVAVIAIIALRLTVEGWLPDIQAVGDEKKFWIMYFLIILLGVLISYISTSRSVVKYLKTQLDELY